MSIIQKQPGPPMPELLCPAGSPLALDAAIEGGADAVYLGGVGFNARINASNFTQNDLQAAVRRAHTFGVKVYLTLNTLIYDREIPDYLQAAYLAGEAGVDALIVADLGGAASIHQAFPTLALHASTQMSAHNAAAGTVLQRMGFSRMVVARELSLPDLRAAVENSPIEIEAFIHGALCVCHSGQCLFSSLVGGRSGNRGLCAQPCRLPYRGNAGSTGNEKSGAASCRDTYPLSLKDLCLAGHVPLLRESGIASLKIEGRMKSPEYVYAVTRIWRRLLDENRAANPDEMRQLKEAFSRDGFTDGYFTGTISHRMLGTRSEDDKRSGRELPPFGGLTRRLPLQMSVRLKEGSPSTLTVTGGGASFTATGPVPEPARNAPLDETVIRRQLGRLGGTLYTLEKCYVELQDRLMMPLSALNALRRDALSGWEAARLSANAPASLVMAKSPPLAPQTRRSPLPLRSALFCRVEQLTGKAGSYFDICYLPLPVLSAMDTGSLAALAGRCTLGAALPPVVTDHERDAVIIMLHTVAAAGVQRVLVGNAGHLSFLEGTELIADGDFRLNLTNSASVAVAEQWGIHHPILSPELTLPQIRDIAGDIRTVVYGRIPLMLLEKCVIREVADCRACASSCVALTDRRGVSFPVLRTWEHRNTVYNSLPTYMADQKEALDRFHIGGWHFLFSVESPAEVDAVILAYQNGAPPHGPIRRIGRSSEPAVSQENASRPR